MVWNKWFKVSERIGFTPKLHEELRLMRSGTIAHLTHSDGDHYVIMLTEDYNSIVEKVNRLSAVSFANKGIL